MTKRDELNQLREKIAILEDKLNSEIKARKGLWGKITSEFVRKPQPNATKTTGVVSPAYNPPQETKQSFTVVRPKTPQQMEWLARERLKKEALS